MKAPQHFTSRGFNLIELTVVLVIIAVVTSLLFPVFGRHNKSVLQAADIATLRGLGLACESFSQDHRNYLIIGLDRSNFFGYNTSSAGYKSWMRLAEPYFGTIDPARGLQNRALISPADPSKGGAKRLGNTGIYRSYGINSRTELPTELENGDTAYIPLNKLIITNPSIFLVVGNYDINAAGDSANINGGFSGGTAADSLNNVPRDWYGNGTANFWFLDGHVESIKVDEIQKGAARYYLFDRILNRPAYQNRPNSGF